MSEGYESIEDAKKSASVRVSESVSDRRMAACVGGWRVGERPVARDPASAQRPRTRPRPRPRAPLAAARPSP